MTTYRIQLIRTPIAEPRIQLSSPEAIAGYCRGMARWDREHLLRLDLNTRCQLQGHEIVHVGTSDFIALSPRHVFAGALLAGARQCVILHNHPSGNASPSEEDRETARRLVEVGKLLDIPMVDFIVIGDDGHYWSMRGGYGRAQGEATHQLDLRTFAK